MTGRHLFGTDGIRGIAGAGPLRPAVVVEVGRALGALVRQGALEEGPTAGREDARPPVVLIGRDPRESGPRIARAVAAGLLAEGIDVMDTGIVTTPALADLTARPPHAAGIMISASHNPATDNGIKLFGPGGDKLSEPSERAIEERVARALEGRRSGDPAPRPPRPPRPPRGRHAFRPELVATYEDGMIRERFEGLRLDGRVLAVDCANGAAYRLAPSILEALGARVLRVACEPDGRNINRDCGALHPERVREVVLEGGADLGLSLDGDGDRVILVDERGGIRDGDDLLLLLGEDLHRRGALPGATVVATIMSNLGLEIALGERGIRLVRTPVGDRHVAREMRRIGCALGGEQSGHILMRHGGGMFGDGLAAALAALSVMQSLELPLSQLASRLQRLPQVLVNVPVPRKPPFDSLAGVIRELRRAEAEMGSRGRVVLRYSGTEPLARVMIEGPHPDRIRAMAADIAASIERAIPRVARGGGRG